MSSSYNVSYYDGTHPCDLDPMLSPTFLRITSVIYAVLFMLGTIGNLLVITVIYKHKEMRSSTNYFLINLSLADLLVLIICMPVSLSEMHLGEYFPFGRIMCYVVQLSDYAAPNASILTLLFIAVERYFAICTPFRVHYMFTARRTLAVCVATWIISIVTCIPAIESIGYTECHSPDGATLKPTCSAYVSSEREEMYVLLLNVCFFAVPCAFLSGIYFIIGRTLRNHDVLMASVSYHGTSRSNSDATSEAEEESVGSKLLKIFSCSPCIKTTSKYDQGSSLQYYPVPKQKRPLERNFVNGNVAVDRSSVDGCGYIEVSMAPRPLKRKQDQSKTDLPPIKEEEGECYSLQTHPLRLDRTVKPITPAATPQSTLKSVAKHRSHSKLIVMLGTVVVVFFVCWLPLRVIALWQIFVSDEAFRGVHYDTLMVFILCSRLLVYINSSINPLLYNLISSKFRRAFKSVVGCHEIPNRATYSKPPSSSSAGCSGRARWNDTPA